MEDTIGSNEEKPKTVVFASSLESALRSVTVISKLKPNGFASEIKELVNALSTRKLKVHAENVARPWDAWQRLKNELAAYEKRSETLRDVYARGVASNPWTPLEILQSLATDSYSYVLAALASHPNSSDALLMSLDHTNDIVARALAGNPRAPEPLLQTLAQTKDVWRMRELILNPNVSDVLIASMQIPEHPQLESALKWRKTRL